MHLCLFWTRSDQAEALRNKNKAARERRAQRVAAKKDGAAEEVKA
jgi:hypothetical protein